MYALDDTTYEEDEIEEVDVYVVPRRKKKPVRHTIHISSTCALSWRDRLYFIGCIVLYFFIFTSFDFGPWTIPVPFTIVPQTLTTTVKITPTGTRTIPATNAHGTLVISNGSILAQQVPAGYIVPGGVEIVLDETVTIPPSDGVSFGVARVPAHAVVAGQDGNIAPGSVKAIIESSLFVRNLTAFSGGADARTELIATDDDRQQALQSARSLLLAKISRQLLYERYRENVTVQDLAMRVAWSCEFVTYRVPSGLHVLSVQGIGKNTITLKVSL